MSLSLRAPMCKRNHAIKCVLDHFFIQIKIPERNETKPFFQRELLLCFIRKNQFLCAIFKLKCSRKRPQPKEKITEIKKIPCKIVTAVNLA